MLAEGDDRRCRSLEVWTGGWGVDGCLPVSGASVLRKKLLDIKRLGGA